MWWEVTYEPTTLFSLKNSEATNAAGKSLLLPSPYSVKMALLNAICTFDSISTAEHNFDLIKGLKFEFVLPEYIVVNNCFIRIMQESRSERRKENPNIMFKSTVVFREYVYFPNNIKIAFSLNESIDEKALLFLKNNFARINYFGKRGCFFQFKGFTEIPYEKLTPNYSREISDKEYFTDGRRKIICKVDDFGDNTTFSKVNNYSKEKTERISKILCLPYELIKSNKNFSIFKQTI